MTANNVIRFPGLADIDIVPVTKEDMEAAVDDISISFVDMALEAVINGTFEAMAAGGFIFDQEEDVKDLALIAHAIRSLMFKTKDLAHPFQAIAEEVFMEGEDGFMYLKTGEEES